jgi:hypothetical protein
VAFEAKGCRFNSYRGHWLVAERFIALVLKTKDLGPWVQIPPSPKKKLASLMVEYVAVTIEMRVRFLRKPNSGSLVAKCPAHNGQDIGSIPIRSINLYGFITE